MPVASLKFGKLAIAGAAGSHMIEPLLGFGEWHLMRSDSLQNSRARAPGAIRIRELLEQTTAQRIEDAPFVPLRVSLCVQTCLPLQLPLPSVTRYTQETSTGLLRFRSFKQSHNALSGLFQSVLELHFCLWLA